MLSITSYTWKQGQYDISLEQDENGMYIGEVKHEIDGFIGGIVCDNANEARLFIDEITA